MLVTALVAATWLMFVWRVVAIDRRRSWVVSRPADWLVFAGVTVALAGVVWVESVDRASIGDAWLEVVLIGGVLAVFVTRYLTMFHAGRVVLSLGVDFAKFCAAVALLTSALLTVTVDRLWPTVPFGAVMVGIIAAFLPLYAVAEVLREGLTHRPHERRVR